MQNSFFFFGSSQKSLKKITFFSVWKKKLKTKIINSLTLDIQSEGKHAEPFLFLPPKVFEKNNYSTEEEIHNSQIPFSFFFFS